jgi:hypothetical protein
MQEEYVSERQRVEREKKKRRKKNPINTSIEKKKIPAQALEEKTRL